MFKKVKKIFSESNHKIDEIKIKHEKRMKSNKEFSDSVRASIKEKSKEFDKTMQERSKKFHFIHNK